MKAWVGFLGLFGLGAGVGFFAGVHFEQRRKRKEEEDILRQEQEESDKIMQEQGYEPDENDIDPGDMDMEKTAREMEEYLAKFEHPGDDEELVDDEDLNAESAGKAGTDDSIELFFDEDRWDSETDYACRELYYYVEDGIVADEDEHRIEDYEDMIGSEAINEMLEAGTGVIFARNSWTEELFKVTQMNNAYARLVLGLED